MLSIDDQGTTGRTVLVVDDDVDLLDSIRNILEDAGYRVATAGDGIEALAALYANVPDLILLDLAMPRMDGATFRTHQARDPRTCRVPVVIMTAAARMAERARPLAPNACLAKPMTVEQLLDTVQRECGASGNDLPLLEA